MIRESKYNEVFDAQRHFRVLLDCMARPGKVAKLDNVDIHSPEGLNKSSALVAFSLINSSVTFFTEKNREEITEYLEINTNSKHDDVSTADFVFIHGTSNENFILQSKTGVLEYPETSATIIIDVDYISDSPKDHSHEIILRGPGVENEKKIYVRNINSEILEAIKNQNAEYPLGVDIILTDMDGNLVCIPRTNNFNWN